MHILGLYIHFIHYINVKGFTLVEILIVFALIAILAAVTFIAINPAKTLSDSRNATRQIAISEILSAITQYLSSPNDISSLGSVPTCPTTTNIGEQPIYVNLSSHLVPKYMNSIPTDPSGGTDNNTGYTICQSSGKVTVAAPNAENDKKISVTR